MARWSFPAGLVLAVLLAGCSQGTYSLSLVFPDDSARQQVTEVYLWAVKPSGLYCAQILDHWVDPDQLEPDASIRLTYPEGQGASLPAVPAGTFLFLAEGRDEAGARIVHGCTQATIRVGSNSHVTVQLSWSCVPDPAGEIPNNGVDDDCDGIVDECLSAANCDDGNSCTTDDCEQESCTHTTLPDGIGCSDDDPCTIDDACQDGTCQAQSRDCSAFGGQCRDGACNPQTGMCAAVNKPNGHACNDGRYCTVSDGCLDGECTGAPRACDDADVCTRDFCDEVVDVCDGVLEPRPGLEGPQGDPTCANGLDDDCDDRIDDQDPNCSICADHSHCDDGNPCTQDTCVATVCVNEPEGDGNACDDGLYCTTADHCETGVCVANPRDCSALDGACLVGQCDEDQDSCIAQPSADGADCDDGMFCTVGDTCQSGACGGVQHDCNDGDPCTTDACSEGAGSCDHGPEPNPGTEGPFGNPSCGNGQDDDCDGLIDIQDTDCVLCAGPADCDDGNPCTTDDCQASSCSNQPGPDGIPCNDGFFCSEPDSCLAGLCTGPARDCADAEACTMDSCDEALDVCDHELIGGAGQDDTCGDGQDQDCDGVPDGCCGYEGGHSGHTVLPATGGLWSVVARDFNADGVLDLAVTNNYWDALNVALGIGSDGRGTGNFGSFTEIDTEYPMVLVCDDFDGDGILDLATTLDDFTGSLAVFLGQGAGGRGIGTFSSPITFAVDEFPYGLTKGDFNDDGITDLAVANNYPETIMLLAGGGVDGVGNGTFHQIGSYTAFYDSKNLAIADLNDDGILDLIVADCTDRLVGIYLGLGSDGQGQGALATPNTIDIGECAEYVTVADLNSDGVLDLAVANSGNDSVDLLFGVGSDGRGTGQFLQPTSVPALAGTNFVAVEDVDGDGITDLIVTGYSAGLVGMLLGLGSDGQSDGTFAAPLTTVAGTQPSWLVAADLDSDRIPDLAVTTMGSNEVHILLGDGSGAQPDGTFELGEIVATEAGSRSVVAVDFDADAILDLAVANQTAQTIQIFLGDGQDGRPSGTFTPAGQIALAGAPFALAVADFDDDKIADLAVTMLSTSGSVGLLLGNGSDGRGDGTFAPVLDFPIGTGASDPRELVVGDFNEDDVVDLAVANAGDGTVEILLGDGQGGLGNGGFAAAVSYGAGAGVGAIVAGDFDEDSITDLAVCNYDDDTVGILLGNGSGGRGNGVFETMTTVAVGDGPIAIAADDFDDDSITDLAVANYLSDDIVFLDGQGSDGRGTGGFAAGVTFAAGDGPACILAGDFNADAILDLGVCVRNAGRVSLLQGNGSNGLGSGTFALRLDLDTGGQPVDLARGEWNADGLPDLVVVDLENDSAQVLTGGGTCKPR